MRKLLLNRWLFFTAVLLMAVSCDDDEGNDPDPVASFQFAADVTDWHIVQFTNFSQNADTYSWNFGDDSPASTVKDPSHTYAAGGTYTVTLTATGAGGKTSVKSEAVTVVDPDDALALLAGETSKTWKLLRQGPAIGIGGGAATWTEWWSTSNNGARPCLYDDSFTFHRNGNFVYNDLGTFWGEGDVFNGTDKESLSESCFEANADNLTIDGNNYSSWLSGTHAYTYDIPGNKITLTGTGAWMSLIKLGTNGYVTTPQASTTFSMRLGAGAGGSTNVDTLEVIFNYAELGHYWKAIYVSYANALTEPALETDAPTFGEDLPNIEPTALGHTFESAGSFDELGLIVGGSIITVGEDDPDGGATKVGKFDRVATELFQEAQLRTSPELSDIVFTNFTTVSVDVYLPSSNTYDPLTKKVFIGFGDKSHTTEWWNSLTQYESDDVALDTWVTITFQLDAPTVGTSVLAREDLDMVFIQIGGGNHSTAATFYVRNLIFE